MHDGLAAHVLELLADWGGVSARRMFSGHGLYRYGVIFGLIIRDTLYLRVDERSRADFAAAGSQPFRYRRGPAKNGPAKEVEISGYMECPPDVLEDAEDMVRWATRALAAAAAAKSAKSARPKRPPQKIA